MVGWRQEILEGVYKEKIKNTAIISQNIYST